jgi:NADPH:quinone reductase-like Zn-dependent oxidoreductase
MRAAMCRQYGPPSSLVIEERDRQRPGAGELLVEVHAAGVNFADLLILTNRYQVSAPLPFVPGSEVAGVVREVGSDANAFAVGDRVMAQMFVDAFAEESVVPAASARRIPDIPAAAAFGVAYGQTFFFLKGAEVSAFNYGLLVTNEPVEAARNEQELASLLLSGRLRPHVSAVYSLEETARSLESLADRRAVGKVVMEMPAARGSQSHLPAEN